MLPHTNTNDSNSNETTRGCHTYKYISTCANIHKTHAPTQSSQSHSYLLRPQPLGVLQLKKFLHLQKDGVEHQRRTAHVQTEVLCLNLFFSQTLIYMVWHRSFSANEMLQLKDSIISMKLLTLNEWCTKKKSARSELTLVSRHFQTNQC